MLHQAKKNPDDQKVELETFYISSDTLSEKEVKNLSKQKKGKVFAAKRGGTLHLHPPGKQQDANTSKADTHTETDPILFIKL